MKIITYKCDLCKEEINKENIYLYYYNCGVIPQTYEIKPITHSNLYSCDKHLCKKCFEIIKNTIL